MGLTTRFKNWLYNKRRDNHEWERKDKTRSLVLRNREGNDYVPEFTHAVRHIFDELPNLHKLETGEETKAAPLEAVYRTVQDTEDVHIYESPRDDEAIVGKKVSKEKLREGFEYDRAGKPFVMFIEPEDGQFIPTSLNPSDNQNDIEVNLISNKDERLNAAVQHSIKAEQKYHLYNVIARHPGLAMTLTTGLAIAFIMVAAGQTFPDFGGLNNALQGLDSTISEFMQQLGESGGAPPGGSGQ